MENNPVTFVGVDPTARLNSLTYAALDQGCRLLRLATGEIQDLLTFMQGFPAVSVAVNAPPHPNRGLVRQKLQLQNLAPGQLRGSDLREAEYEIHAHGIHISNTPSRPETCPGWMQLGFDFFHSLESSGYLQFPAGKAAYQMLETHPHAAFCVLLKKIPLSKSSLEGRIQRQMVLYEQGVGIRDPMDFFEEITRRKLLHGTLPVELIYLPEELDALVAAYVAWWAANKPGETLAVGEVQEGQIILPVNRMMDLYA